MRTAEVSDRLLWEVDMLPDVPFPWEQPGGLCVALQVQAGIL